MHDVADHNRALSPKQHRSRGGWKDLEGLFMPVAGMRLKYRTRENDESIATFGELPEGIMMGSQLQAWRTAQRSQSIDRAWKITTMGLTLLFLTATIPPCVDASSFGTAPSEPTRMLLPTTCSPPKLAGPPQFLSMPKGTAKYPFSGVCTSPESPGDQIQYRLEGSWSPSETDPNKPNASESVTMTGFEPFIPIRAPGGSIFMYWTARCKTDPWLQPENANCRLIGTSIPDDLREAVPNLLTLNFPKTDNMIGPADRQRLYAQYLRLNSPIAGTKLNREGRAPTPDMFIITNPVWNAHVQLGQLFVKATPPKIGATPLTGLEFRWLDAPPDWCGKPPCPPYVHQNSIDTSLLLQGYQVEENVIRGHTGRWEVRARSSGKAVPGPWSFPVLFRIFLTQPTQSQRQTSPVQQTAPLPSSSVVPPSPVQQSAPLPSSVTQAPTPPPVPQAAPPPPSSVMQAPASSSSTPAQMNRSSSMFTTRGVEGKKDTTSKETIGTSSHPEKKP